MNMDNAVFEEITKKLHQLTQQYQSGALKHYVYVQEVDRTYENYGCTKKDYIVALNVRLGKTTPPDSNKKSLPTKGHKKQ